MKKPRKHHTPGRRPGFALIIALSLMALMVLLTVSLSTMVQVELSTTSHQIGVERARQNAMFGMQVALGQLQKHAGPDQRATATADVYYSDPDNVDLDTAVWSDFKEHLRSKMKDAVDLSRDTYHYQNPTYMTQNERKVFVDSINAEWNNNPDLQPRWVGVWDTSIRYNGTDSDTVTDSGYHIRDRVLDEHQPVWLVSGFDDENRKLVTPVNLSGVSETVTIVDTQSVPDPNDTSPNGGMAADGLSGIVKVPKVGIYDANGVASGAYAYFVSDESQKINVTLRDQFSGATPGGEEYVRRLISPQRSGLEGMSYFDTAFDDTPWDVHDDQFDTMASLFQLPLISPDSSTQKNISDSLKRQFHSISTNSIGIFTDSARGGLKKDLTHYFQTGNGLNDNDPIADPTLYENDSRIGASDGGFPASDLNIPQWGQLKEWVNNVSDNSSDPVQVTADTRPMLMQFRLFYGFSRSGATVKLHVLPILVLWNQFDAPLEAATYRVQLKTRYVMDNVRVATKLKVKAGATEPYKHDDFIDLDANPEDNTDGFTLYIPATSADYHGALPPKGAVINETDDKEPNYLRFREAFFIRSLNPQDLDANQFLSKDNQRIQGVTLNDHDNDPLTPLALTYDYIDNVPTYMYTPFPLDEDNEPVALEFVFTTSFEAGEHLIFTPVADQNLDISDNPIQIDLENEFLSTGPDGQATIDLFTINGPATGPDERMKIHQDLLTGSLSGEARNTFVKGSNANFVFSMLADDELILAESEYGSMTLGGIRGHFSIHGGRPRASEGTLNTDLNADGDTKDTVDVATYPATSGNVTEAIESYPYFWRWLYHDYGIGVLINESYEDQLAATSIPGAINDPSIGSNAADMDNPNNPNSPIVAAAIFKMEPIAQDAKWNNDGKGSLSNFYRAFGIYNLSAKQLQVNSDIEFSRGQFGSNNEDGFERPTVFQAVSIHSGGYGPDMRSVGGANSPYGSMPPWDDEISDNSSGRARAFSLIENKFQPGGKYKAHSIMPLRAVNRNPDDVLSIAQLAQANIAPYFWQPSFVIGNSEASPYVSRSSITGIHRTIWDDKGGSNNKGEWVSGVNNHGGFTKYLGTDREIDVPANTMVDLSYLMNDALWDSYFLSSIPQTGDISAEISGLESLPHSTYKFRDDILVTEDRVRDFDGAARYLYNLGSFNVNTTSVDAWKAFLTAFRGLTLEGQDSAYDNLGNMTNPADTSPVAHSTTPLAGPVHFDPENPDLSTFGAVNSERDYIRILGGFRYLSDPMIEALAERIVDEIRFRGPFMSLSDFVNRRLVEPDGFNRTGSAYMVARTQSDSSANGAGTNGFMPNTYDPWPGLTGINGALQRAINLSGINGGHNYIDGVETDQGNTENGLDWVYRALPEKAFDSSTGKYNESNGTAFTQYGALRWFLDTEHMAGAPAGEQGHYFSHSPGFISQADILSMIGSKLTARGDTFKIRSYGEAKNQLTGEVIATCWLEALVQRLPDPVHDADGDWEPDDDFGRKFKIVGFRWLTDEQI
ncbi:hypothetical protein [Cerasicoccus fimbriatus]|uniref:hypothetical protein n=1 Tax=Cerasicoccus fimbriatus TaxID=3014554 RepID=UPI0022B3AE0F|nr:hypothetical protein [Cerasicoccus sp. TK19100]